MCPARLLLICCCLLPFGAAAQALPALDRGTIAAGLFANRFHLDGRIDADEVPGSERNFSEDFGFDSHRRIELFEASVLWAERHQLEYRRYSDQRRRRADLNEAVVFDGETFPIQLQLEASAAFRVHELGYTYWWRIDSASPVGMQLGVMRLQGRLGLSGRIEVEDIGEEQGSASVEERLDAPVVGLALRHLIADRWRGFAELRSIYVDRGRLRGHAYAGKIGLEYFPTQRWGLTAQYAAAEWRAKRTRGDYQGELQIGFDGPQLLLKYRF